MMRQMQKETKTGFHRRISPLKSGSLPGRGKTRVEIRYYKRNEYDKLTKEQKAELYK